MARRIDCRKGLHHYSLAGEIGAGIARRTCSECGVVKIDLGPVDTLSDPELFTQPKLATMFKVEAVLARVGEEVEPVGRSFGQRPAQRRRPARAFG